MKFIFFGPSKEIDLLTQKFDKTSFSIYQDAAEVLAKAKEGPCLVFLNFDFNAEHAKTINESLSKDPDVKRIVFSKTRDLKKEKIAADEYIQGPLNKASFERAFQEVMGGKTLSGYTIEGKTSPDTNKSIQDAFDSVFAESKEEAPLEGTASAEIQTTEAAPEEVKTETPMAEKAAEPGAILDEESDLQFSVGGMEIPSEVKAESETPKPEEEILKPQEVPAEPAQELSGMTLDEGTTEPTPAPEEAGLGDLEIPSIGEEIPALELGGAEEAPSPAPDLGMDLDLAAPDSTVVAPSPSPVSQPPQKSGEIPIPSDPSMEFTAATATEESIEEKDQSREFVYDKPGSTRAGTGSSEILAKPSGMEPEIKQEIKPEVKSKAPEKAPFKVSDESVIKLEAIIRALREERESLLKEVKDNRELKTKVLSENLNLEATTEELRVELAIIKKRNEEEFHEDSYERKLINEKLKLADEKNKRLQKDIDILSNQAQIDTNKVLQREKELENQLELLSMDSQNQILSREKKISELNRERDAMEYNMTNLISREKKLRQEKLEIEEKLNKIMRTMRNSIDFLEDEIEGNQKLLKELKK